jgi:hypothetical protein
LKNLGGDYMGGRVGDNIDEQHGVDKNLLLFISNFNVIGQVTSAIFISLTL